MDTALRSCCTTFAGTKRPKQDKKENSGKSYWRKFRKRKRSHAVSNGRSDEDGFPLVAELPARFLASTSPTAPREPSTSVHDSLRSHLVHPGRRELLASSGLLPANNAQVAHPVRDSSVGSDDGLEAHQVNAQRRELIACSAKPQKQNGRARWQAKARQKKARAKKGLQRDKPDYSWCGRSD